MILRQRLLSNMFLRNMLADLFGRSAYFKIPGKFIPYFLYKIEDYHSDHYLYFPKEPYALRYQNEIFNKLCEYNGYDLSCYLNFHYSAYNDKPDFLQFVQYELSDRLKLRLKKSCRQKLQSASEWVSEKQKELQSSNEKAFNLKAEESKQHKLGYVHEEASQKRFDYTTQIMSEKLNEHIDRILTGTEERLESLTNSFVTGNIELNNHNHLEKVVQLFILLQTVQAPAEIAKAEQLFKRFSCTDMASILHLHFTPFKDKKINTMQVKIREASERLRPDHTKVKVLTEAMRDFFYK